MAMGLPGSPPLGEEDPLLLPSEVAARCRIHVETMRRWIRKGAVAAVRVGPRVLRIRESEAQKLLRSLDRERAARHTEDNTPHTRRLLYTTPSRAKP